ncbi:MAG TPA: 2-phospho-L-lactate guanylyltransferase [Actinomycetota bacterium]|nr:2-phospho-L-lactate guanylyltransferase [Actinomycetota bacterium]
MPVPLVPVKALAAAKGRLAPWLSPLERRLLAIAMFEDVVAALQATPGLAAPLVVSPDREMWRRAEAIGCRVVEEPAGGEGLNAALARAAGNAGDDGLLVVAADLPLASAAGLRRVLKAAALAPVVVVPSHDGDGTNVLAWREPASFAPRFGPGSATRHLSVPGAVRVDDPQLAMDVDTVEDLRLLAGQVDPEAVTGRRLRDLRLAARLGETG